MSTPAPIVTPQGSTRANSPALSTSEHKEHKLDLDAKLTREDEKDAAIVGTGNASSPGAASTGGGPPGGPPAIAHMSRLRFVIVFASLMLTVFLFALDQLILATAIPAIVSEFNSLSAVGWLQNGFFQTLCAFTLAFSQYLVIFPSKYVLLFAVFIFEVGSLVCGVAPSMNVLILGRCIAGVGAAGIFGAAFQTVIEITTLQERPTYIALFGACFGLSSIIGPLLGGALTDQVTWRWCFYLNLPIGGLAFFCILFLLDVRPPFGAGADPRPMWKKIAQLDWVGVIIALGATTCLCLGLQWGGVEKPWKSAAVIVTLVLVPVSLGLLWAWEYWLGPERAMVPLALLKRRTMIGSCGTATFGWMAFMAVVLYLSIGFQAINGHSATRAGTDLLPMIVVQTVLIVLMGRIVAKFGHYKWICVVGPCVMAVGCGLVYSVNSLKHFSHVLGFEVFIGVGVAMFLQNVMIAVQVELRTEPRLISRGIGTINFISFFLGRIVGISVATSIFSNLLPKRLSQLVPDLPAEAVTIVRQSVAAIRNDKIVPLSMRDGVIEAYRVSIRPVYLYATVACLLGAVFALLIKNDSTHEPGAKPATNKDVEKQAESEPPVLEG